MFKIAVIGAGNMGGAIVRGLVQGKFAECITAANPSMPKLEALKREFPLVHVTQDNRSAVRDADLVILAVKPWKMQEVVSGMASELAEGRQMVASVAGGMGTAVLDELFRECGISAARLYYVIPNTAVAVKAGVSLICPLHPDPESDSRLLEVFGELGYASIVEERLMDAGMILSSCGVAFIMRYLRAMTEGGVQLGCPPHQALELVMNTMKGAVALLESGGLHPEAEIDRVTTPGGITIRGLNAMERAGFTNSVIEGLLACLPQK